MPNSNRGKFIVIYGSNNIGKSEQIQRLSVRLVQSYKRVLILKYPIYELVPTGPLLNDLLRGAKELSNPISDLAMQSVFAQNRRDFQPVLNALLDVGIHVLAEDYTGTGLAWGIACGLSRTELEIMNTGLLEPDLAILLDGKRFTSKIEKKHRFEGAGNKLWDKNRKVHLDLAKQYGWYVVSAERNPSEVQEDIWDLTKKIF